ncbi:uncharacterized protein LOC127531031 isoform X2 [Acanthochromis polyacanthus]|nr:uncharacterized protein LOC127531031 isoform X2 [Acanthochromis polyacanthus]
MGYKPSSMLTPKEKDKRCKRVKTRAEEKIKVAQSRKDSSDAATILLELSTSTTNNLKAEDLDNDADDEDEKVPISDVHDACLGTISRLQLEKQQLMMEMGKLQEELWDARQKLQGCKFTDKFLEEGNRDSKTQFFTGMPSYGSFLWLLGCVRAMLPVSMTLSPGSILLLVLMKLRLNLVHQDLAYRFNVSRQTVTNIIAKSLPVIASELAFLVHWSSKEETIRNMPKVMKDTYKKCRVIIDCCEIFIERPGNFTAREMTWSNYKSHNTLKVLVAVAPCGSISFVSKCFGGRVSDKVITQRSGFLQLLEHGDLVLANHSFLIADDLAARGAQLAIPAFTRGKAQLSPKEIEIGRRLSPVRVHVQRAIERVKNFRVLSTTMRMNLVPQFDNIMTICSGISNLHKPLIA